MKNIQKIKFIALGFVFSFLFVLAPVNKAQADTYIAGDNSDVLVTVNLDYGTTYTVGAPFSVTGMITPMYGASAYTVDMSVIADGIFTQIITPNLLDSQLYNTIGFTGPTATVGLKMSDFSTGIDDLMPINPPSGECVGTLTFNGQFRRGKVIYNGPAHPALSIGITEVGYVWPQPGSMTGEYPAVHNFTMPSGGTGTHSFWEGNDCNAYGCEFEGTGGFDHAYVSSVSPSTASSGGKICVQQAPIIPPGCRFESDAPGRCWQKSAGMQCSSYINGSGLPAEDC
jgi:hypothetical protein